MKKNESSLICILLFTAIGLTFGADSKPGVSVNEIAAEAKSHLGPVNLIGVVAILTPGKGFVLVDQREYGDCGLACLTEKGTKKIPVQWTGAPPKLEDTVRVEGTLSKSDKGLIFTASKVAKQ